MYFDLTNTQAAFHDYIHKILTEKLNIFVKIYLDDMFIYIVNAGKEYIQAVQWVLDKMRKHSLYANLKKCRFHQHEVRFLGYIVSHQGIQMKEE